MHTLPYRCKQIALNFGVRKWVFLFCYSVKSLYKMRDLVLAVVIIFVAFYVIKLISKLGLQNLSYEMVSWCSFVS